MKHLYLGELALLAGTRAMLGLGAGLLLAGRLGRAQRRTAGWTLLSIGLVTTLPLLLDVFNGASGPVTDEACEAKEAVYA